MQIKQRSAILEDGEVATFKSVSRGDTFKFNGNYYMKMTRKIEGFNVVRIVSGDPEFIDEATIVLLRPGTFIMDKL